MVPSVCMAKPYKRERLGHVVRFLAPPPVSSRTPAPRLSTLSRQTALGALPKNLHRLPPAGFRFTGVFGRQPEPLSMRRKFMN